MRANTPGGAEDAEPGEALRESNGSPATRAEARSTAILSRLQFLEQVHLEKRRADRSKAPLSMVFAELTHQPSEYPTRLASLAKLLRTGRRETDIQGCVSASVLALLLPDTGAEGAQAVVSALKAGANGLQFDVTVATYPDDVFERLLVDAEVASDFDPLLLRGLPEWSLTSLAIKRLIDLAGAFALLLVASPLMLIVALAIAATSKGPVIFRQVRLGRAGTKFVCYKFRSMRVDADDRIHREYVSSLIDGRHDEINEGDDAQPQYKIKADPRVTRVGRMIRATSIDELPQVFNVIKGDMSLVGPRPPLPYEGEKYQSWHLRRVLEVRPGITGLWQVEGRSRTSFDDMVRLDLRYIDNWSPWLDIKLLAKTVVVVLRRDGAA